MNELWTAELLRHGAQFDNGRAAHFGDPAAELEAAAAGPIICDLSHEGLILAAGEDAATFLHGQFSNEVLALAEGDVQWNSWNSPKAPILTSFLICKGPQGPFPHLPPPPP